VRWHTWFRCCSNEQSPNPHIGLCDASS
jgi:hypothetical protein